MTDPDYVFITIDNVAHIPFINRLGPISTPISVSKTVCENLKTMGFMINVVREVGIDCNGNRYPKNVDDFIPADLKNNILPEVAEAIPNVFIALEEAVIEPPIDIQIASIEPPETKEVIVEETEEELSDEDEDSHTEESDDLVIYSLDTYKDWSARRLREHLTAYVDIEGVFTPEELEIIHNNRSSKANLLEIIEKTIIPLGEEE